jgi:hypothetical protein
VVGGHGKDQAHLAQQFPAEAAAGRWVAAGADDQIGAAVGQGVPAAAEGLAGQAQAGFSAFGIKLPQQVVKRGLGQKIVDGYHQLRLPALGHLANPTLQAAGGGQQVAALPEQFQAGLGEHGAVAAAVEEQGVQVLLQFAHGVGEGGRHPVQGLGGGGEAAVAVDGVQGLQGFQAEFHIQII